MKLVTLYAFILMVSVLLATGCVSSNSVIEMDFKNSDLWSDVALYFREDNSEMWTQDRRCVAELVDWLHKNRDNVFLDFRQIGAVIPPVRMVVRMRGNQALYRLELYEYDVHSEVQNGLTTEQFQDLYDIFSRQRDGIDPDRASGLKAHPIGEKQQ